ncbi:MAG TPA: class I SAM-dependent methyltransferase [bacterium]|nr:class I SAM-dependent methyltransferase [bacterium]
MNKKWNQFYNKHGRFYIQPHPLAERIANRFKTYKVRNVLDMGSGTGRHLVYFAGEGFNLTGIDFSPSAVELAKKWLAQKSLSAEVNIADIHEHINGAVDASYDAVIAVNSLQYSSDKQFDTVITEVNRILKEGGLFWLVVPSKETKIDDINKGQVFYSEEQLKGKLSKTFRILEFARDKNKSFSILAQEK